MLDVNIITDILIKVTLVQFKIKWLTVKLFGES